MKHARNQPTRCRVHRTFNFKSNTLLHSTSCRLELICSSNFSPLGPLFRPSVVVSVTKSMTNEHKRHKVIIVAVLCAWRKVGFLLYLEPFLERKCNGIGEIYSVVS